MANVTDVQVVANTGRRYVVRLLGELDTTNEAAVTKVDISTLTDAAGTAATYSAIDRIEYDVAGFASVELEWDATANDKIVTLTPGQGIMDWSKEGGLVDPKSTGTTGDIKLTTTGTAGATTNYNITIWLRPKA